MKEDKSKYMVYIPFQIHAHSHQGAVVETIMKISAAIAQYDDLGLSVAVDSVKVDKIEDECQTEDGKP